MKHLRHMPDGAMTSRLLCRPEYRFAVQCDGLNCPHSSPASATSMNYSKWNNIQHSHHHQNQRQDSKASFEWEIGQKRLGGAFGVPSAQVGIVCKKTLTLSMLKNPEISNELESWERQVSIPFEDVRTRCI